MEFEPSGLRAYADTMSQHAAQVEEEQANNNKLKEKNRLKNLEIAAGLKYGDVCRITYPDKGRPSFIGVFKEFIVGDTGVFRIEMMLSKEQALEMSKSIQFSCNTTRNRFKINELNYTKSIHSSEGIEPIEYIGDINCYAKEVEKEKLDT